MAAERSMSRRTAQSWREKMGLMNISTEMPLPSQEKSGNLTNVKMLLINA